MKYKIPFSILTPVDPAINEWLPNIPEKLLNNSSLMSCLLRLAPRIYNSGKIGSGVNPFYKIVEILGADKLYYHNLQIIKEYYDVDMIRYLTQDNLAEFYVGYPCHNANELRSALCQRKNKTNELTLISILSAMV